MIVEQKFETKNPSKIGFSNHCLTQYKQSFEKKFTTDVTDMKNSFSF